MKVQFYGNDCFTVEDKDHAIVFNPDKNWTKNVDVAFLSSPNTEKQNINNAKKTIHLPGEFEISGLLVRGFYTDDKKSIVYKVTFDGIAFIYMGSLNQMPSKELLKKIGENMDVVFVCLNEQIHGKKMRELGETLDARLTFLGGDKQYIPKIVELGATMQSENIMDVNKSTINEDKVEMIVLNADPE